MIEYENIISEFLDFCETKHYTVVGVDRLYKRVEEENVDTDVIARVALFNSVPLMIEIYKTKSIGLFFNMFECDPLSASFFTRDLLEWDVELISAFVEMKDNEGKLEELYFGEKAIEQYTVERKNKKETLTTFIN